ncbi:MAG: PAS domain S-box protein [Chloroflexota bacterium]|nr:PAS domain S-box protein [Chloroflexota bacterium]
MAQSRKSSVKKQNKPGFKSLLESLPEMIFEADVYGNITLANRLALQTFGYTHEDLGKGLNITEIVMPEQRERAQTSLQKLISGEQTREELGLEEYVVQNKDGAIFPITIHTNRVFDKRGNLKGFRGVLFNISENKQAKEALRESEEKLRFIIDSISDSIVVTDMDGNIVEVNKATLRKAGYLRKEDIVGQNAFEFIALKDVSKFQQDRSLEMDNGIVPDKVEYTLWAADGKKFDAEISSAMLHDSDGNPTGYIGVVRDVTSRKIMEQTLKGREERLQAIVENAPDAIFIYDNNGTLIYGNRKSEELTGYLKKEFIGKNVFNMGLISEESIPLVLEKIKLHLPGGPQAIELINKQGKHLTIEVMVFPAAIKGNIEFIGIARDITDRTRMEKELNEHRHHLERMVEQRTIQLTSVNQQLQKEALERKRAEEELRKSEEKLRFIFECMKAGIVATDLEANITEVNDAALNMTGYSREEIIGHNGLEFMASKDRARILKDIKKIFQKRHDVSIKYDVLDKDGAKLTVDLSATLLHDSDGTPTGFMSILRNVANKDSAKSDREEGKYRHS